MALAIAPLAVVAVAQRDGRAADHLDGPGPTKDPAADLADLYAFTSPENPAHLTLAVTWFPLATTSTKFNDNIEIDFKIREITGTSPVTLSSTPWDVKCTTSGGGMKATCTAPGGLTKTVDINAVTGAKTDDIRVFAGLRSDPFFFDLDAFKKTVKDKAPAFTTPGKNFFQGLNVLTFVVEIDTLKAFGKAAPIVTVAAEARRKAS
jgi:hypothetical protein